MVGSPQEYASKLEIIRGSALEAGRDPEEITPALHRFVVVGPTEQETRAMLETKAIRAFGLAAPAELWRKVGLEHPFGEHFRGYVDFVPELYDRKAIEEAIAAVPPGLVEEGPLMWGTPEQLVRTLREFGEVRLRHVVLAPVSGLVSKRAAIFGIRATRRIARLLTGER